MLPLFDDILHSLQTEAVSIILCIKKKVNNPYIAAQRFMNRFCNQF